MATLLLSAPPLQGGEYLSGNVLRGLSIDLDQWIRDQVTSSGENLAVWLKKHATLASGGTRLFSLAENKRDSEFQVRLSGDLCQLPQGGRVQYQPLGKALQEYAGERNKNVLIHLLLPVQRASEKSAFVKELVDSGEVFHPLALLRTPAEAYRLLPGRAVSGGERSVGAASGLVAETPRPRVAVASRREKAGRFGVDAMLDFKVELALGEQTLTEKEWRQLLQAEEGLIF